jgi:tetratricopeptide (TPR) repeat protein
LFLAFRRRWQRAADIGSLLHRLDFVTPLARVVFRWLESRGWSQIGKGLPAIAAAVVLAVVLDAARSVGPVTLIPEYRRAADRAARDGDLAAAELWLRKVVWMDASDPAGQYALAMITAQNGDRERAYEMLQRIAPSAAAGYPEAHFRLACAMQGGSRPLTPDQSDVLVHHLNQALRSDARRADAHVMLGQLKLKREHVDLALVHLQQAAAEKPSLYLLLAQLHSRQNQPSAMRDAAERAAEYYRQQAARDPGVWQHHVNQAQSQLFLQDTAAAIATLERSLAWVQDPAPIRDALASTYLERLRELARSNTSSTIHLLNLLERAVVSGPENPQVLAVLARLTLPGSSPQDAVDGELQRALAVGPAGAIAHLISGLRECAVGRVGRGTTHLALAQAEGLHDTPAVVCALARWIVREDPDAVDQALRLLDGAAEAAEAADFDEISSLRAELSSTRVGHANTVSPAVTPGMLAPDVSEPQEALFQQLKGWVNDYGKAFDYERAFADGYLGPGRQAAGPTAADPLRPEHARP